MQRQINSRQSRKFVRQFNTNQIPQVNQNYSQNLSNLQDLNLINNDYKKRISSVIIIQCLFSLIKKVKLTPSYLVPQLEQRLKKFDINNYKIYYPFFPDKNFSIRTSQGKEGIKQLVKYLQNLQMKQQRHQCEQIKVKWSHQLHCAAMKRAQAIQRNDQKIISLDIGQLVNEFVHWRAHLSQLIIYGFIDPKQILIQGFLQDSSQFKNNRQQFFNQAGRIVGIGMAEHPIYRIVTIILFAGDLSNHLEYKNIKQPNNCQCKIY